MSSDPGDQQQKEGMRTITVLRAEQGILSRCEITIEQCPEASTGWGIVGVGPTEPINATETTTLMGWGNESGDAIVHGCLRIPITSLPRPFGLCKGEFEVPDDFNQPCAFEASEVLSDQACYPVTISSSTPARFQPAVSVAELLTTETKLPGVQ